MALDLINRDVVDNYNAMFSYVRDRMKPEHEAIVARAFTQLAFAYTAMGRDARNSLALKLADRGNDPIQIIATEFMDLFETQLSAIQEVSDLGADFRDK